MRVESLPVCYSHGSDPTALSGVWSVGTVDSVIRWFADTNGGVDCSYYFSYVDFGYALGGFWEA